MTGAPLYKRPRFYLPGMLLILVLALGSAILLGNAAAPQGRHIALVPPAAAANPYVYSFNVPGVLEEASSMQLSSSPYWWLNSGGELIIQDNVGETFQGDVPSLNRWHGRYAISSPTDTDRGTHPQNLFRLVTRSKWENLREEISFLIEADNFSPSFNRNTSNGLLLMSRYAIDGQTLYYAGIRVDGTTVIKKKYHGTYYTMAQQTVFPGTYTGWQDDIDLIPHHQWIRLRSDTVTNPDGSVTVNLYMRLASDSGWQPLQHATDSGQYDGTPPITGEAYAGIRTDFMDIHFDTYRAETIQVP